MVFAEGEIEAGAEGGALAGKEEDTGALALARCNVFAERGEHVGGKGVAFVWAGEGEFEDLAVGGGVSCGSDQD
jgi:hypothetical protein